MAQEAGSEPDEFSDRYAAFAERGRAALCNGEQTYDRPLGETYRWGVSVVFRPAAPLMERLVETGRELRALLGPEHWVHGPGSLHSTLRALETYRAHIPEGDERIRVYAEALDEAATGMPPLDVEVRGVGPHQGGVLLFVRPTDKTLAELQSRMDEALHARDACRSEKEHVRDLWNIGLVHFTRPLADPAALVAWCDAHRELDLGTTTFDALDIVRARPAVGDVRLETLHRAVLRG